MPKRPKFTPEQLHRRALASRRWQEKQKAAGRCVTCGAARKKGNLWHCARHATENTRLQHASIAAWGDEAHVRENRKKYREKFAAIVPMLEPGPGARA